jgi:ribosomal protein S18 acetylase RimI-like enzyme
MLASDSEYLLGTLTDVIAALPATITHRNFDNIVFETPTRRDYWFGTYVVSKSAKFQSIAELAAFWHRSFPRKNTDCPARMIVQWEIPANDQTIPDSVRAIKNSFGDCDVGITSILTISPDKAATVEMPNEFTLRMAQTPGDFAMLVELALAHIASEAQTPATASFVRWKHAQYRAQVEAGSSSWWMLSKGGLHVAQCGLVNDGRLARFQEVTTHPEHRRNGYGRMLCGNVLTRGTRGLGLQKIVVASETDTYVEAMYGSLGFKRVSFQVSVIFPDTAPTDQGPFA